MRFISLKLLTIAVFLFFILITSYSIIKNEVTRKIEKINKYKVGNNLILSISDKIDFQILLSNNVNENENVQLHGTMGENLPNSFWEKLFSKFYKPKEIINSNHVNINWNNNLKLDIEYNEFKNCHTISWSSKLNERLKDCFDLNDSEWYGGPETRNQVWPVESLILKEVPYITKEENNMAKMERYWLNSKGVYLFINDDVPLFIDMNNNKKNSLCFIANNAEPYRKIKNETILEYHVCSLDDPRKAQEHAIEHFFGKPSDVPETNMIKYPIWSTWAHYKSDIDEKTMTKFAKEIKKTGLKYSNFELDDNWETCYGSGKFNKKFPNIKNTVKKIQNMGFKVTLWRHPFININCPNFEFYKNKNYFVKDVNGNVEIYWWNGKGAAIDFTNPEAVEWYQKLNNRLIENIGIDGFKFDAGEVGFIPRNAVLNSDININIKEYTKAYLKAVSIYNKLTEVRVTDRTQNSPLFVRMIDKDSKWGENNGLLTLINTMFVMNIHGYSWVLPDMVGGNNYDNDKCDKELFIRWLQATTFMPAIQFSIPPWDFDSETVEISRKYIDLHYEYSDKIIELMYKTVKTGAPLNPPIWWVSPKDETAQKINSEYLLGEDILVAPVIVKGATSRDIYLPDGYWQDANNPENIYKGSKWIKNYYADLSTLPYFIRIKNPS